MGTGKSLTPASARSAAVVGVARVPDVQNVQYAAGTASLTRGEKKRQYKIVIKDLTIAFQRQDSSSASSIAGARFKLPISL
jgi:hypothetical protein